jgi:hypothetical protein
MPERPTWMLEITLLACASVMMLSGGVLTGAILGGHPGWVSVVAGVVQAGSLACFIIVVRRSRRG